MLTISLTAVVEIRATFVIITAINCYISIFWFQIIKYQMNVNIYVSKYQLHKQSNLFLTLFDELQVKISPGHCITYRKKRKNSIMQRCCHNNYFRNNLSQI